MTTIGIRQDVFTSDRQGRMTDEQLVALVNSDHGIVRKLGTLHHQATAALADGDIATAAYIEQLKTSITR